jgi:4-amino-4-deoxy-L-arabinose transferase-like glycosyltransferase
VHTDIPATLFMTLAVVLTIATLGASPLRWILAGASLGLAIAAKFTALILLPLVVLAPLLLLLDGVRGRKLTEQFAGAIAACVIAALVVMLIYTVNLTGMHPDEAAASSSAFLRSRNADPALVERFARLTKAFPAMGMFVSGIEGVRLVSEAGSGWTFLHGRLSRDGFPHYFFVAFLVKSSPVMLFLTAAVLFGGHRLRSKWAIGLLAPVVTLFAVSIPSAFNIGVRHILPAYPLLAIVGAGILASRLPRRAWAVAVTLPIVMAGVSLWRSHPHELGYFNAIAEAAGGGAAWLSDSNIDWGQDIGRLQKVLRERGWERDTTVEVFYTVVHWPVIARYRRLEGNTIPPGRYAVSAYVEQVGARENARMKMLVDTLHVRGRRVQRVGSSITIWEVSPE